MLIATVEVTEIKHNHPTKEGMRAWRALPEEERLEAIGFFGHPSMEVYVSIDGGPEELSFQYFANQDELGWVSGTGIIGNIALAALRHYQICETCYDHVGMPVMGYMAHGFEGNFCECCLAKQRMEHAVAEAAQVVQLTKRYQHLRETCSLPETKEEKAEAGWRAHHEI